MWPVFLELLHVRHNFEPNVSSHTNSHNFKVVSRFWISEYQAVHMHVTCFPGVTSCKTQLWAKCLFPYNVQTLIISKLSPTFHNTKQFTCMWPVFQELLHVRHNFEPMSLPIQTLIISKLSSEFFQELLHVRHNFETNFLSHTNSHNFKFQIVQVHVEFLKKLLYVRQNFGHMHLLLKPKY